MVDKLNSMESSAPDKYMSRRYRLCKGGLIALVGVTVMGLYVSPDAAGSIVGGFAVGVVGVIGTYQWSGREDRDIATRGGS